jgi:hypothetical protein
MIKTFLHNYKHDQTFRKECNIIITCGIIGSIALYGLVFVGTAIGFII